MSTALQVSSDVYFFSLGLHASASGKGGQIQDWAFKYGLGRNPNIDIPNASAGLIPTPAWRNRVYRSHKNPYIDRPWNQGDNVNLAVGQGDVMVTPLQLARAYAALANGGTLVTPHLGGRVVNVNGKTVRRIKPQPTRHLPISDENRSVILGGLERAAMEPGGTSYPVMGGFPFAVAGKTGRGPVLVQRDRALWRPPDRGDRHGRAWRLRRRVCGADRPLDPGAVLRTERRRCERRRGGIGWRC
jgi:penicillin-binding protein 2